MYVNTPPMGWNSWNTFAEDISDSLIRETADAMVETGLRDLGYNYLVIDDCWSKRLRDENGRIVPDPDKFPNGIKPIADYVHSKGLKFGMYSCAGAVTCARYPGSFEHEYDDAKMFADWGVDFLKYDYCYHSANIDGKLLYRRMGAALENCGRDILFSACTWGADNTEEWIKETSASMWRSTNDIHDDWENVKDLIRQQFRLFKYAGKGCFNDMDMLVVGMSGDGKYIGEGMNETQYRTHFNVWSMFASPLIIGCDIRHMSDSTKKILMNKEVIAINQDPAARQPYMLAKTFRLNADVAVRQLAGGDFAICMFNLTDHDTVAAFELGQLGVAVHSGKKLFMHNCETGEELTVENYIINRPIAKYDSELWRCRIVD